MYDEEAIFENFGSNSSSVVSTFFFVLNPQMVSDFAVTLQTYREGYKNMALFQIL